jgi:hypothetical protein
METSTTRCRLKAAFRVQGFKALRDQRMTSRLHILLSALKPAFQFGTATIAIVLRCFRNWLQCGTGLRGRAVLIDPLYTAAFAPELDYGGQD